MSADTPFPTVPSPCPAPMARRVPPPPVADAGQRIARLEARMAALEADRAEMIAAISKHLNDTLEAHGVGPRGERVIERLNQLTRSSNLHGEWLKDISDSDHKAAASQAAIDQSLIQRLNQLTATVVEHAAWLKQHSEVRAKSEELQAAIDMELIQRIERLEAERGAMAGLDRLREEHLGHLEVAFQRIQQLENEVGLANATLRQLIYQAMPQTGAAFDAIDRLLDPKGRGFPQFHYKVRRPPFSRKS